MGRLIKKGLDYFRLDVDFFEDDKIQLINAEFGAKGENIALRLLCLIYRNGYWYKLGDDENLLLAKRVGNGVTGACVSEVVKGLVRRSFFDERVFNSFQILTSKSIQIRFFDAIERRKTVEVIPEIMLIDVNEYINDIDVNINHLNVNIGTQRREEKRREIKCSIVPFDVFWDEYDKKVNRDKSEKKWNSLTDQEQTAIMDYVPRYKAAKPDKQFRKDPLTFLNNRSWEDEIILNGYAAKPGTDGHQPETVPQYTEKELNLMDRQAYLRGD